MSDTSKDMPAFPAPGNSPFSTIAGMTLRDYFAARALASLLSGETINIRGTESQYASAAFRYADAMLKAREL